MSEQTFGLTGILVGLGLLIFLAFRGFTLLLAAPVQRSSLLPFRESRYSPNGP